MFLTSLLTAPVAVLAQFRKQWNYYSFLRHNSFISLTFEHTFESHNVFAANWL